MHRLFPSCPWLLLIAVCCTPTVALAQRELKDIPLPDPAEEQSTFRVTEGFEVNLFAADPAIRKPIQMNFDADGRLWIAASEVYPQVAPGQKANDKVLILEDADGDGVSDKTTVFADGLLIPTGVLPGDGGVYVANSTELLHFKDTDGDGKADQSRIVLSGFGTEDTHHIIHTFRWGPDTRFYFNQSIYIHSHIETPTGVKRLNAGGIWQFRPDTLELNVLARGWVNTWGHQFDQFGQSFVTDGAGGEGINYLVPGASYFTAYGAARILPGLNPGSPKYCGLEIVDGRHLPDDWQGNLITHDFRGHRVCRFAVSEDASGFSSRQLPDVITTDHVAFRPIDVAQGPDGAIYIADWYNPIIQHGEVDFRDPRRDHTHGRIWRLTAKGRDPVKRQQLSKLTVEQLLEQLRSSESYTRLNAKRVLKERSQAGEPVSAAVQKWVTTLPAVDPAIESLRLEGLWLMLALNEPAPELLEQVFAAKDGRVRAAAVRVLTDWRDALPEVRDRILTAAVNDPHPRVRLEAVRVLAQVPAEQSAELALAVLDQPVDQFLDYALWQTVRELQPQWLPQVVAGTSTINENLRQLIFAVQATQAVQAIPQCVAWLKRGDIPDGLEPQLLNLVASLGGPEELRLIYDLAVTTDLPPARTAELLRTLVGARKLRQVTPSGDLSGISDWLKRNEPVLQQAAAECIGAWQLTGIEPQLIDSLHAKDSSVAMRAAALTALAQFPSERSRQSLVEFAGQKEGAPEQLTGLAVALMAAADADAAAAQAVDWLKISNSTDVQLSVYNAFLQSKSGPQALTAALANQQLPADVAKIGLRAVTGSGRAQPELSAALANAGSIKGEAVMLSPDEMAALITDVKTAGDAARGEALFRRGDLSCFKCHAIGGAGGKVGPDLISIGASAQVDYLIDSLLQPNKNVKEGFQTLVVETTAGKLISGVKLRESDSHLFLRDADDHVLEIPKSDIEEQANGASLMPAGLTDKLTRSEVVDLVRFLSELGKVGRYAVTPERVARRWLTLVPDDESYRRLTRTSEAQLLADDTGIKWQPAYSTVGGELPLGELPTFTSGYATAKRVASYIRCELQVTTAGNVAIRLNSVEGVQAWLDGQPVAAADKLVLPMTVGLHKLTFAVDRNVRREAARLVLDDASESRATVGYATGQ